ncbi:MAG: hypothetical protein HN353_08225 [Bdellovibrionales bacterium]|nr:hypothetical protein [Bdellovibrionales bacterium]MBT3525907.1 hypothetical protein [Bdellovibrionales bacterium]MBT7766828.1 hypothetical protein [Bdellovibrionales bacterium]
MLLNSRGAPAPGEELERKSSISFHQKGTPLLISAKLLRSYHCGQIDLARITCRKSGPIIELGEVKSRYQPSERQYGRLRRSANFLAQIFNLPATLTVAFGQKEPLPKK